MNPHLKKLWQGVCSLLRIPGRADQSSTANGKRSGVKWTRCKTCARARPVSESGGLPILTPVRRNPSLAKSPRAQRRARCFHRTAHLETFVLRAVVVGSSVRFSQPQTWQAGYPTLALGDLGERLNFGSGLTEACGRSLARDSRRRMKFSSRIREKVPSAEIALYRVDELLYIQ